MKTEGLTKAQKYVRIMLGLSCILTGVFVPIVIIHFLYIFLLIPNLFLIYHCHQLSEDMEEFVDRIYKLMHYIAEDALNDISRHVYFINLICAIMFLVVFFIFISEMHERPIFALAFIPLALYVVIYLMSDNIVKESFLKELLDVDKEEEEYEKKEFELKLPKERPLKKK